MKRRLASIGLLLVSAVLAGATVARAASTTPAITPNWSGYAVTGPAGAQVSYTRVTGTWSVPTVTCSRADAGASSTVWVGLGGYGGGSEGPEQVGTNADCDANGKPTYYAWFELVPDIAHNIEEKVFPGDTITASVNMLSLALVELQVKNRTRHWTFTREISWGTADTSSAEWISEAPARCARFSCRQASLANFGGVTIRNIAAVGNGAAGTLAEPDWTVIPIWLVPGKLNVPTLDPDARAGRKGRASSPAGAIPGPASVDGGSFRLSWVANATRAYAAAHTSGP